MIKDNCFLVIEVTTRRLVYFTFIMTEEYDLLIDTFDSCDVRAQIMFTGPPTWIYHVYESIREINETSEVDVKEGFPLYKAERFNHIWHVIKTNVNKVNKESND